MLSQLKKRLYFVVAAYFAFWAKFVLRRWRPRIIVVTGSSGKTTLLHLIEAQLSDKAVYSHHANSETGIALFILGMPTNVPSHLAWLKFGISAPFHIFRRAPAQKLFVVEADCDRPREGALTSEFLKPEVVLWVSVYRTHSMNFDPLVQSKMFASHEQAIAYEFGNFAAAAQKLVVGNGDQPLLVHELHRAMADVEVVRTSLKNVSKYELERDSTEYIIDRHAIHVPGLHPREMGQSLQMVTVLLNYLGEPVDTNYRNFVPPPGRSSVYAGKKHTILIDSTYNTGLGATEAVLELFEAYSGKTKWLVLGDILEQGSVEKEEHEKLARIIAEAKADQVILLGPRTQKYTYPVLQKLKPNLPVAAFEGPKETLDFLNEHLKGGETILFKGARGMEGVVEQLLADPKDADNLVRREASWVKRRQAWGLPR